MFAKSSHKKYLVMKEGKVTSKELKKIVLIIVGIMSICMPFFTLGIIVKVFNYDFNNPLEHFWVFLVTSIIPLITIIIGIIFRKEKGIVDIIVGSIVMVLLLLPGLSWLAGGDRTVEYEKIYEYKDILDIELPSEGKTLYNEYDGDYYTEAKGIKVIDVYYEGEYSDEILNNIKKNDKYIESNKIDAKLIQYLPVLQRIDDKGALLPDDDSVRNYLCYYMIYNKTNDLYNEEVKKKGEYEMYVVRYDHKTDHLSISNYIYVIE